jgi:WD40 repeat protein
VPTASQIKLWDLTTLRELPGTFGRTNGAFALALSGDGQKLATLSGDLVQLWDVSQKHETIVLHQFQDAVGIVVAPDGATLAICTEHGKIVLFDIASQTQRILTEHDAQGLRDEFIFRLRFSPDGKLFASSANPVLPLQLWDVPTGKLRLTLTNENTRVDGLAFSPDAKTLATTSTDQLIRLWDTSNGQLMATLKGHLSEVWVVAFSPDGKTLATGSKDTTVRLWSAAPKPDPYVSRVSVRARYSGWLDSVAGSPDCKTVLTINTIGTCSLWDTASLRSIASFPSPSTNFYFGAVAPGASLAALGSAQGDVQLMDLINAKSVGPLPGGNDGLAALAFSSDARYLAAGRDSGTVDLWELQTRRTYLQFSNTLENTCHCVAFSPDSKLLGAAYEKGLVEVWDIASRRKIATLAGPERHIEAVVGITFSPDAHTVYTASLDGKLKKWNAITGALEATFGEQGLAYLSVALSPDGSRLVTRALDDQVKLWDAPRGQELMRLTAGSLRIMGFYPDGNALVLAGPDELSVWRAPTFAEIDSIESASPPKK